MIRSIEISEVNYIPTEVLIELSEGTAIRFTVEELIAIHRDRQRRLHETIVPIVSMKQRAAQFLLLHTFA